MPFYLLEPVQEWHIFAAPVRGFFGAAPAPALCFFFLAGSGSKDPKIPGSGSPALCLSISLKMYHVC